MKQYSFVLCLIFLLGSCANIQDSNINLRLDKSNCFQEFYRDYDEDKIPLPVYTLEIPESPKNNFPKPVSTLPIP